MGLIAAAAIILTTQTPPVTVEKPSTTWIVTKAETTNILLGDGGPGDSSKSQEYSDRFKEIWGHIDNRATTQIDVWFQQGEFPSCISLLRVQNGYEPDDEDVMSSLGWMLENTEQLTEAREIYKIYSDRHPNYGDAAFYLGYSYSKTKDWDNTIKYLEPSLVKNPSINTYRLLAKTYERKKMYKDAIRVWELELKRFPNEGAAVVNIKRVKAKIAGGAK